MRPHTYYNKTRQPYSKRSQLESKKSGAWFNRFAISIIAIFAVFIVIGLLSTHANAASQSIKSGFSGYCLDDHQDIKTNGAEVDIWDCNNSDAQNWSAGVDTLKLGGSYCLGVKNNSTTSGSPAVLDQCDGSAGEVWLRTSSGYENPNSDLCLNAQNGEPGQLVDIASCGDLQRSSETWTASNYKGLSSTALCNNGSEGVKVACYAEHEWTVWQSGTVNHSSLLNQYSDYNGYEEWCADFVSYVYREAGYPFSQGERDNWDEYNANNIQYESGFTVHQAGSYVPKAGDVAFFDYPGGHVELVVSGGKTPTFVYGDSDTIDPSTGNGDMATNTLTSVGGLGQVQYYLSPND